MVAVFDVNRTSALSSEMPSRQRRGPARHRVHSTAAQDLEQLITELCNLNVGVEDVVQYRQRIINMLGYLQQLSDMADALGPAIAVEPMQSLLSTFLIIEKICRTFARLLRTADDLQGLSIEQQECISCLADSGNLCVMFWCEHDQLTATIHIRQQLAHSGKCCRAAVALKCLQ